MQVAIVGRPNVGKSTLFNRIIGRRRAITDAMPGVTRDPVGVPVRYAGRTLRVVDTGGFTTDGDELARAISDRAIAEIERSSVVLLLLDATEFTALDEEFLEQLRPFQPRMVLVVNKLDTVERDHLVWNFHALGVPRVVGVSSAHGRGVDELEAAVADVLDELGIPPDDGELASGFFAAGREVTDADLEIRPLQLAVLGRPNTGKSTLVNRLTGTDGSLVSPVPGTTRDVIEGEFEHGRMRFRILDTAGIRRKSRVSEDVEYYSVIRAIDTIEEAEVVVLLVDADKGLSDQDKKIASLVVDKGRGLVLGLNKWDLLPRVANQFQAVKDRILFMFPVIAFAPIVPLSASRGDGVADLLKAVVKVRRQLYQRVETGVLNRHLEQWLERTPPPMRGKRRLRVRYMTQVQRYPVTFVAFVNQLKGFPDSYVGHLRNQIRADFGLDSIPLRLELRER